jgi:putative NIF3 family GTP cyclohydrolase 1 type 2
MEKQTVNSSSALAPTLTQIAAYLDRVLGSERFPRDQESIYRPSSQRVARIGLALEPWPGIESWIQKHQLDALFLHRPWKLDQRKLPEHIGVLTSHLPFDATLTLGYNPRLAQALAIARPIPFGYKDNIPLGMHGPIEPSPVEDVLTTLAEIFGKAPTVQKIFDETIDHIALVNAMNEGLIQEAAAKGVRLYITGQFRPSATKAMRETEMTVAEIGHTECERWGLRALAGLLRERWHNLDVQEK